MVVLLKVRIASALELMCRELRFWSGFGIRSTPKMPTTNGSPLVQCLVFSITSIHIFGIRRLCERRRRFGTL